jgi:hypothetical protein
MLFLKHNFFMRRTNVRSCLLTLEIKKRRKENRKKKLSRSEERVFGGERAPRAGTKKVLWLVIAYGTSANKINAVIRTDKYSTI